MKKVLHIVFVMFYLTISVGIVTHVKTCHSDSQDLSIYIPSIIKTDSEHTCCESETSCCSEIDNCCSESELFLQFTEDEQLPKTNTYKFVYSPVILLENSISFKEFADEIKKETYTVSKPPPKSKELYLLYCSLLDYA